MRGSKDATKETEEDANWFQTHYDLKPDGETFALHYDADFHSRKYELLEVSDDVYEQLMDTNGDEDTPTTIEFKGEPDEEAVLCTKTKTFVVKRVETSNTLLLCAPPGALDDGTIEVDENGRKIAKTHAQVSSHLDLTEIAPRLDKLKMMLEKKFMLRKSSVEEEQEEEEEGTADGDETSYGFDFLLSKVQASEMELKNALENPSSLINAVKVGENRWRGIDEEAIEYVLGIVMASAVESGKYDFSRKESVEITAPEAFEFTDKKFPIEVLDFVLRKFGFNNSTTTTTTTTTTTSVGKKREREGEEEEEGGEKAATSSSSTAKDLVVQFKLERYIKHRFEQNAKFNYIEVINAVNEEITVDEFKIDIVKKGEEKEEEDAKTTMDACTALFAGLAFFASENDYKRNIASALVANAMPREPKDRFMELWKSKPKWLLSELEPYLEGMVKTPGMTQEAMLLKYCRVSTNTKAGAGDLYSKR